ncbi:SANT and BTB domain regulator of class switch recombination-like isoform X2 [Oscarella lobularis]|uniref:SANT and BTB domain regulator of class switch recombination-like isoform X2 n=1 Tax=Oscarella lobularis TaxID=121494 RepID=UPI003313E62F
MTTIRSRSSATRAVTLDLMLRTFMNSTEFVRMEPKNWEAVARLIPGTTAKQCALRWEELLADADGPSGGARLIGVDGLSAQGRPFASAQSQSRRHLTRYVKSMLHEGGGGGGGGGGAPIDAQSSSRSIGKDDLVRGEEEEEEKTKLTLTQRPSSQLVASSPSVTGTLSSLSADSSRRDTPEEHLVIIHVSDGPKNLHREFQCSRDLLLREMRYFVEYLPSERNEKGPTEIAVHCDINVFETLMRYVKRGLLDDEGNVIKEPKIDANNSVSILISSDFLRMDVLVDKCINFIHKNISAVVGTPGNMTCIRDGLIARLAGLFSHSELEAMKDRRDKLKSKFYFKKLLELFRADDGLASTLFQCRKCRKLLTRELQWKIKCTTSSLTVGRRGVLLYCHERNTSWDVNDYMVSLREEGMNWRQIYWRVWSLVNHLNCVCCGQTFSCGDYARCAYHPEESVFDDVSHPTIGYYPCCGRQAVRFDAWENQEGCAFRDHVVTSSSSSSSSRSSSSNSSSLTTADASSILKEVLSYRDSICLPSPDPQRPSSRPRPDSSALNIFRQDEEACGIDEKASQALLESRSSRAVSIVRCYSRDSFNFSETDEDFGQEEEEEIVSNPRQSLSRMGGKSRLEKNNEKQERRSCRSSSKQSKLKSGVWNVSKSTRWNVDSQRENGKRSSPVLGVNIAVVLNAERRMFRNLIVSLASSCSDHPPSGQQPDRTKNKESQYPGGIFSYLEDKWRALNVGSKSRRRAPKNDTAPARLP